MQQFFKYQLKKLQLYKPSLLDKPLQTIQNPNHSLIRRINLVKVWFANFPTALKTFPLVVPIWKVKLCDFSYINETPHILWWVVSDFFEAWYLLERDCIEKKEEETDGTKGRRQLLYSRSPPRIEYRSLYCTSSILSIRTFQGLQKL